MKRFDEITRSWLETHIEMLYRRPDVSIWTHKVALLAIHSERDRFPNRQFLVKIGELEKWVGYLRRLNVEGYNIYASVNVLKPEAQSRKVEEFLPCQVAVYLDLDSKEKPAHQLWKEIWKKMRVEELPEPSWVIKSSKGNYQVYWIFEEPVESWKLESIMKGLNQAFGLDHTHDIARVFRLPGFRNKKPGKDDLVQPPKGDVIWIDKSSGQAVKISRVKYRRDVLEWMLRTWGVRENAAPRKSRRSFEIKPASDSELKDLYEAFYSRRDQYKSPSEVDAAFVARALLKGYSAQRIASFLAFQRSDKPNPAYYADKTVREVCAWLREKGVRRLHLTAKIEENGESGIS